MSKDFEEIRKKIIKILYFKLQSDEILADKILAIPEIEEALDLLDKVNKGWHVAPRKLT